MPSFVYNKAAEDLQNGTINLLSTTVKAMLVTTAYTPARSDLTVSGSGAGSAEISVTGYTGGFGGSGRKALSSKVVAVDQTNNRSEFFAANLTWTALGTGATIGAMILVVETTTSDANTRLLAYLDVTDTPTNGGDIAFTFDAEGIIQFSTV